MTQVRHYHLGSDTSAKLRQLGIYIEPGNMFLHPDTVYEPPIALPHHQATNTPFRMGAFSYSLSHLSAQVHEVGRYCSLAGASHFGAAEHPTSWLSTSSFTYDPNFELFADFSRSTPEFAPRNVEMEPRHKGILIEHDVWIGGFCYIRGGVTLGTGCIVGTGSVVTKNVPPYAIVAGNPARVRRFRFPEPIIERLLASRWWTYKYTDFARIDFSNVEKTLDWLESTPLEPFSPSPIRISDHLIPIDDN